MINKVEQLELYKVFNNLSNLYYQIPKYQREYTWRPYHINQMYNDIMENDVGYFMGPIIGINIGSAHKPALEVIDGQQRLTTLSLLLGVLFQKLFAIKDTLEEEEKSTIWNLKNALKSDYTASKLALIPQSQSKNLEDYNYAMCQFGVIDHATYPNRYGNRMIARAVKVLTSLVDADIQKEGDAWKALKGILDKVNNTILVSIEVDTHSSAYMLFESLNNRGQPLTAIELMKNKVMAQAENSTLDVDTCYNRWQELLGYLTDDYSTQERFFRHYYNAFKNELNEPFRSDDDEKDSYPLGSIATKSNLLKIYEKLINKDLDNFLTEMQSCGQIYSDFIKPTNAAKWSKSLLKLQRVQAAPSYLILLYLIKKQSSLSISDEHIEKLIKDLINFFLRRNVTDVPNTRELDRIFMDIIKDVENNGLTGDMVYSRIIEKLKQRIASVDMFVISLRDNMYNKNAWATRYILCELAEEEQHMNREDWIDFWKREDNHWVWTIEHIFPKGEEIKQHWVDMIADGDTEKAKELREQHVHKLGNLTITGYNSTLSDDSFLTKRDYMKDGKPVGYKNGLAINKELAVATQWKIKDIENRTEQMIKEILKIFAFPGDVIPQDLQ